MTYAIAFWAALIAGLFAACSFGWAGGVIYVTVEVVVAFLWNDWRGW